MACWYYIFGLPSVPRSVLLHWRSSGGFAARARFRFHCRSESTPGVFTRARESRNAMSVRGEASLKAESSSSSFSFQTGELVLVKWGDGMVYFAKIKRIDRKRGKCTVVFDDKSHDEAEFDQIHSGEFEQPAYACCPLLKSG